MHKFLLDNELYAPATLVANQPEIQYTWTSPKGTTHRIDYVIVLR